jgi:hypothetical protein
VIKWNFFDFNIIYVLFCFAIVVIANYIYNAHVSPVYFRISVIFCDVSVFIIFIILDNIVFSREDLDVIYLIIDNQFVAD